MNEAFPRGDDRPTTELLSGILGDTRELVVAHADRLREEIQGDLRAFKEVVVATMVAALAIVVASIALGAALVATLWFVGVPLWAATWIVFVLAAAAAVAYVMKMRRTSMTPHVVEELEAAKDDVAWAGKSAVNALEGEPLAQSAPPTHPLH